MHDSFFQHILDSLEDYAVITTDGEGIILSSSKGTEEVLGYSASDLVGKNISIIYTPEDLKTKVPQRERTAALEKGKGVDERYHLKKDGSSILTSGLLFPFVDTQGNHIGFTKIIRDIQEVHAISEKLKKSEARYRALIEKSRDGITISDAKGNILYCSPSIQSLLGYSPDAFLQMNVSEFFHPEEVESITPELQKVIQTPGKSVTLVLRGKHKNGTYRWFESTVTNLTKDPSINGFVSNFKDITERKEAEQLLVQLTLQKDESISYLDSLISHAPLGFAFFDREHRYIRINDFLAAINGIHAEDHIGKAIEDLLPVNAKTVAPIIDKVFRTGVPVLHKEVAGETPKKPGKRRYWITRYYPVFEPNTRNVKYVGVLVLEITKRKEAEKAVKDSERFLKNIINNLFSFVGILNADGTLLEVNRPVLEVSQVRPEDVYGKPFHTAYWWEDSLEAQENIRNSIERAKQGERVRFDIEAKISKGTYLTIDYAIAPVYNRDGELTHLLASAIDISNRKNMENALRENEENFRNLADSMPQLVWITRPDGYHEYYNQRWYEYTKTTYDDTKGKGWSSVLHPDDYDKALELWNHSLKTGEPYQIEYRIRNGSSGEFKWFLGRAVPVKDEYGTIKKWFGTCTEIHEQKEIEDALRRSEAQFKALVDTDIIGVMRSKVSGEILEANDSFLNMLGYTRTELDDSKMDWHALTPMEYSEQSKKAVADLFETGFAKPFEKEYIRKDGTRVPVIVGSSLLDRDSGEAITFILDITERKKLEQRKDEFIGIASHELKTPLTSIKGYTQILERIIYQMGDEKLQKYLHRTNMYIDRLDSLIADLLDVSKIQAGKLQMDFSEFVFDELIRDSVDEMLHTNRKHEIIITGSSDSVIEGDRHRLEQVFTNLLSNAIKYSPNSDKIIIHVEKQGPIIHVAVQDFGVGIPASKISRLFDRFYRVEETSKRFSGLGIGLYISNEIIQRHGGKMWVESDLNRGSTFHFTLPVSLERYGKDSAHL
jgi:PAS domain S-box-containing protein